MSKFIDSTGLTHLWGKIKNTFVAQEDGKGLSTNDFTNEDKARLDSIEVTTAASHYEGVRDNGETDSAAIARILAAAGATAAKDDTLVIKTLISDDKYSYTAFVYDGEKWAAMDGNYDAENVYFNKDIIITKAWGNITIPQGSGKATIPSNGKNVPDMLEAVLSQDQIPATKQPGVTVKISNGASSTPSGNAISVEAGTSITPKYQATLSAGGYTFGPATGVTATSWSIEDTKGNSSTESSGTFTAFKIAAGETYKVTATATHNGGAIPVTALEKEYPAGQIQAGSKSNSSPSITGYREGYFIGSLEDACVTGPADNKVVNITSAQIRSAAKKKGGNYSSGSVTWTVPVGAATVFIAVPSDKTGMTKVLNTTVNADMTTSFASTTVKVAGADGDTSSDYAADYTVWAYSPAEAYGSTANVTITLG